MRVAPAALAPRRRSCVAALAPRRRLRLAALGAAVLACVAFAGESGAEGTGGEPAAPRVIGTRVRSPVPTPTVIPEPPPAFGRVIYRAVKAASFESLGVTMIACRHRDPEPRRFAVEFFEPSGKKVSTFGPTVVPNVPPGRKLTFVSDGTHFPNRDVYFINARVGHLAAGTARVISDARTVRCAAKIRFDPGARAPTYWRGIGFHREGTPPPAVDW